MKAIQIVILSALCGVALLSGCVSQEKYNDVMAQNRIQRDRINELESELNTYQLQVDQMQAQLQALRGRGSANTSATAAEIAALEADIEKKKQLIAKMQAQLLRSGVALPMELSVKLQEFADKTEGVDFDPATGMLKFQSDLLFDLGSDNVSSSATGSIRALSELVKSPQAENFDIIIAGHTDDVPIRKPSTKAVHPTNWHLSAHRAISVLNMMIANDVSPERISVQGFGEYDPVEPNKEGQKGNPANRRVEIYLVPAR